jgi:hypothetical protein
MSVASSPVSSLLGKEAFVWPMACRPMAHTGLARDVGQSDQFRRTKGA